MNNSQSKIGELKLLINGLTDDIAAKVADNLLEEADALLKQRHNFLAELIAIPMTDDDRENLIEYLNKIRSRDQHIVQGLKDDRDKVKNALSKIGQLKNYLQ